MKCDKEMLSRDGTNASRFTVQYSRTWSLLLRRSRFSAFQFFSEQCRRYCAAPKVLHGAASFAELELEHFCATHIYTYIYLRFISFTEYKTIKI